MANVGHSINFSLFFHVCRLFYWGTSTFFAGMGATIGLFVLERLRRFLRPPAEERSLSASPSSSSLNNAASLAVPVSSEDDDLVAAESSSSSFFVEAVESGQPCQGCATCVRPLPLLPPANTDDGVMGDHTYINIDTFLARAPTPSFSDVVAVGDDLV